jgi:hypothetical protein
MRNGVDLCSNDFEIRINVLILKSIIVIFDLSIHSDSVWSQKFIIVQLRSHRYLIYKLFFVSFTVSDKFTDWNTKFFDKSEISNEPSAFNMRGIVYAQRFVWFFKRGTPGKLLLFLFFLVELSFGNKQIFMVVFLVVVVVTMVST